MTAAESTSTAPVIEFRQYQLVPGGFEALATLYDDALVELKEEIGIRIIGQFADLDDPDRFVFLRGHPSPAGRKRNLHAFYTHPGWLAVRNAVNEPIRDISNVHLLQPVTAAFDFQLDSATRLPIGAREAANVMYIASIVRFEGSEGLSELATDRLAPVLAQLGAKPVALLMTHPAKNTYPRLPVIEDQHVVVAVIRWQDVAAANAFIAAFDTGLDHPAEHRRLKPTSRSLLR